MKVATATVATAYRFHETVAFYTAGMGHTVYLTPSMARRLGHALLVYASDCEKVKFTDSHAQKTTIREET